MDRGINQLDGVLVPSQINNTWEAVPIETWGSPPPEMPETPNPQPPARMREQEHGPSVETQTVNITKETRATICKQLRTIALRRG